MSYVEPIKGDAAKAQRAADRAEEAAREAAEAGQLSLLGDPGRPHVGPTGLGQPETSALAARANSMRNGSQRQRIGEQFYRVYPDGLTDEQAAEAAGVGPRSSPWKRCSELREWGFLVDSGERRTTESGSSAVVWRMTPDGVREWTLAYHR